MTSDRIAHARSFIDQIPQARALGLEILSIGEGRAEIRMPWSADLVGDPETGVIHGGVITSLLDNACGIAVQLALPARMSIATLDLRLDYMKPATPKLELTAHTHCYKVTTNIAFVRGTAYHEDEDDPIATCVGTFMLAANRAMPMPISPEAAAEAMNFLEKNKGGTA